MAIPSKSAPKLKETKGSNQATLTNVTKSAEQVVFEITPQKINRSFSTEYSKLPVLATHQPLLWYQHSVSTIVLPSLLLFDKSTGAAIAQLEAWTKPAQGALEPATLKFNFAHLNLPRCKLESVEVIEDMWKGGASPTRAEVTLTLLLYPEPPLVKTAPAIAQTATNVKLTDAEKTKYLSQVLVKIKSDKKYSYKEGDTLAITDDLQVTLNTKPIGKLTDFVALEKKHQEPIGAEQPKVQATVKKGVNAGKSTSAR